MERYNLFTAGSEESFRMVMKEWKEGDLQSIASARTVSLKYEDKQLQKLILLYEVGHCYYVYKIDLWDCMEMFGVSRPFFKYACKLYKSEKIVEMIKRRKLGLDLRCGEMIVGDQKLEKVNFHFKTNMYYGPKLMDLIAVMVLDDKRSNFSLKDVIEKWKELYPTEKVPSHSTVSFYCFNRLRLSYKKRLVEPKPRNSTEMLDRRLKLIFDLYFKFSDTRIEVVWYD